MSKNGVGKIQQVGQDISSGNTVVYCVGTSAEIADSRFSLRIPEGEYAFYSIEIAKKLRGKTVLFNYLSISDTRTPRSITFKAVLQ